MNRILIIVEGYIGDCLFASSVASRLVHESIEHNQEVPEVDYAIQVFQPYELLLNNKDIMRVWLPWEEFDTSTFDAVYTLGQVYQDQAATIQYQLRCGVKQPTLGYTVFTNPRYDHVSSINIRNLRYTSRKVVAVQMNWKERTFGFTRDEYANAPNHPMGYGRRRRDTDRIVKQLAERFTLIFVGFEDGVPQSEAGGLYTTALFSQTASIIKHCDYMVGAEGGLTNLAAGVGTKTIITGDFIHQVYGPRGSVRPYAHPMMGPRVYFPHDGHVTLDPFLTDDEVAQQMISIIEGDAQ